MALRLSHPRESPSSTNPHEPSPVKRSTARALPATVNPEPTPMVLPQGLSFRTTKSWTGRQSPDY